MITILTYHDVFSVAPAREARHYDITAELLRQHLEVLATAAMVSLAPEKLQVPARLGSSSYFLSFDDGAAQHAGVTAPLLEAAGVRGIFFVPTQRLNRAGYLTTEDVKRMHDAGHVFGLHGHQHRRLDHLSESALEEEFSSSRKILREITGQNPWIFAPVGGYHSPRLTEVAKRHGVLAIRTMRWGLNRRPDPYDLETVPLSRDFDGITLLKILKSGHFGSGYGTKEFFKNLLPETLYQRIRQTVPRIERTLSLPSRDG